ncbi:hypothetical protein ANCDUO_03878 [Ancylostoma duodenale]|uniref:Uncharacterized protein n=1 Tax=Ancylostoma duodenale TaxID=51022 RepID=A0A0C2H8F2_9BILA|nr:hypothetical protein ANCDUO_03878 [Ancylostoma duodenale]
MNTDSFEQLTTRIGRLLLRRCGSIPALTIFVAYAPSSSYDDEEIQAFYMDSEKFYRKDHTFHKFVGRLLGRCRCRKHRRRMRSACSTSLRQRKESRALKNHPPRNDCLTRPSS